MICKHKNLINTVITADALHCQKDTARAIVERSGEYYIQLKDNQKTIHKEAQLSAKKLSPFLNRPKKHTGTSTMREIALKEVTPLQIRFPHVQTIIKIWHTRHVAKHLIIYAQRAKPSPNPSWICKGYRSKFKQTFFHNNVAILNSYKKTVNNMPGKRKILTCIHIITQTDNKS